MFAFNLKSNISPEISKYIKEQTNKSIQRQNTNNSLVNTRIYDFDKNYFVFPFVSLFSFIVGYKCCEFMKLNNSSL